MASGDPILIEMARKKLDKTLESMRNQLVPTSRKEMMAWGHKTLGIFKAKRLSGRPGLIPRTGDLRRSFSVVTRGKELKELSIFFSTRSKYAATHEGDASGGPVVIKAGKTAKMLAIPFPGGPAQTPSGDSRFPSPLRANLPGGTHDFFVLADQSFGEGGQALLMGDLKGSDNATPWFILKRSVTIPPRLRFKKTISKEVRKLVDQLRDSYKRIFKNG